MRGSIHRRELKDGTLRYDAYWRVGRKQHKKTCARKRDAEAYLEDLLPAVRDGSFQKVRPRIVDEIFDAWLSDSVDTRVLTGELKDSTASTYRSNVRVHLKPALGRYRSDQLTAHAMKRWRKQMATKIAAGEMAAKTFNNLLNLLHQILDWARHPAQGFMSHDPLVGQRRLRVDRPEAQYLEDESICDLLAVVADERRDLAIVSCALFAGLRRGEIFGLQWDDVEWNNGQPGGRLQIRRSVYQGIVRSPKTVNSVRTVDVPRRVLDALAAHRYRTPPMHGNFVFRTQTGEPVDPNSWYRRHWPDIRRRAKLADGVSLHSLRHTYASLLIRNGENPKYVSRQVGHASTSFTMDTYGHLFQTTSEEAMRRLEATAPPNVRPSLRVVGT